MQFIVKSRAEVEANSDCWYEPHIIISITDPDARDCELLANDTRLGVLRLKFWDIDQHIPGYDEVYGTMLAKQVRNFVNSFDVSYVIVHCEAGISRSAGVAAALNKYHNGSDEFYFKNYRPNQRVYSKTLKALERS